MTRFETSRSELNTYEFGSSKKLVILIQFHEEKITRYYSYSPVIFF